MKHPRTTVGALTLSAGALVAIFMSEGFTDKAVIPVPGDRPTVGIGSTFRDDGSPVQMGDTIKPIPAIKRSYAHISKDEERLKQCITASLYQTEYDILIDFSYQYGVRRTCSSVMVKEVNAGNYAAACQGYARYSNVDGKSCAIRSNGCYGVFLRNNERMTKCLQAQQ